jgi:hypothetical protein
MKSHSLNTKQKMATRRGFLFGMAVLAIAAPRLGLAQGTSAAQEPVKKPVFLFIQSAKSVTYDNGKLTLKGVSAATVFFSDRPERVTGHMSTRAFIPFWKEGKESFLSDPPNATLSLLGQGEEGDVVIEVRDPVLKGDDLSYSVKVLQGDLPAKAGVASLFIDIVGMPTAPMNNAGAERRMWRRRGYY